MDGVRWTELWYKEMHGVVSINQCKEMHMVVSINQCKEMHGVVSINRCRLRSIIFATK